MSHGLSETVWCWYRWGSALLLLIWWKHLRYNRKDGRDKTWTWLFTQSKELADHTHVGTIDSWCGWVLCFHLQKKDAVHVRYNVISINKCQGVCFLFTHFTLALCYKYTNLLDIFSYQRRNDGFEKHCLTGWVLAFNPCIVLGR